MKSLNIVALTLALAGPLASLAQKPSPALNSTTDQQSVNQKKAVAAKDELWKKLSSDPSVVGVGVGSNDSSPIVYVYVTPGASKETLHRIPKKCGGIPVSVIKSDVLKPQ